MIANGLAQCGLYGLQHKMAAQVVKEYQAETGVEGLVYGEGEFVPGRNFCALLDAASHNRLRGIVGISFSGYSVQWGHELRGKIAPLLQLAPKVFAADELSVEWGLHFGLRPEPGVSLAWLYDWEKDAAGLARYHKKSTSGNNMECELLGEAILGALMGKWLLLTLKPGEGANNYYPGKPVDHHPFVRFAKAFDCSRALQYEGKEGNFISVDEGLVERAKSQARKQLEELFPRQVASSGDVIDMLLGDDEGGGSSMVENTPCGQGEVGLQTDRGTLSTEDGGSNPSRSNGPRRCELGSVFDPETHYTAHYYDGRGLEFMNPDGRWQIYNSTALYWEGNRTAVGFLTKLFKDKGRMLDVGCSAGDWVEFARELGWDAWGADISQEAIGRAPASVREHLKVADVTKGMFGGKFDFVTTRDLLEHIWEKDIDALIDGIHRHLTPGGTCFNVICTRGEGESDHTMEPGCTFTQQNSWLLVSGHVMIRDWWWWAKKFQRHGFKVRNDLAYLFQVLRSSHPTFKGTLSWSPRNLLIVERPLCAQQ